MSLGLNISGNLLSIERVLGDEVTLNDLPEALQRDARLWSRAKLPECVHGMPSLSTYSPHHRFDLADSDPDICSMIVMIHITVYAIWF